MCEDYTSWVREHIDAINKTFDVCLSFVTKKEAYRTALCIDVYETEQEFNDAFDLYDNKDYTFELQCEEGLATVIDGKYVFFNEINYEMPEDVLLSL